MMDDDVSFPYLFPEGGIIVLVLGSNKDLPQQGLRESRHLADLCLVGGHGAPL